MVVVVGRWVWFGCWFGSAAAVGAGAEIADSSPSAGIVVMITVSLSSIITIMIVIGRV